MTVWVDSKGKVFTNVVQKDHVPVRIQTSAGQIQGWLHVLPGQRLSDDLNREARFIAVTEARLFGPSGEVVHHAAFLALNKEHIIWVFPEEAAESSDQDQQA